MQEEAYGAALDKSELPLREAKTARYQGLVFATWDATRLHSRTTWAT